MLSIICLVALTERLCEYYRAPIESLQKALSGVSKYGEVVVLRHLSPSPLGVGGVIAYQDLLFHTTNIDF